MKARSIAKFAAAAVCAVAIIPSAAVYAAESGETVYPDTFVLDLNEQIGELTDYAVDGNNVALASNTTVYILSGESAERKMEYKQTDSIEKIDYADGCLYVKLWTGNTYAYSDLTTTAEHDFPAVKYSETTGSVTYMLNNSGELKYFNTEDGTEVQLGDGFSKLKKYDDTVYAVKDNRPYVLDGYTASPIDLSYFDFARADNIYSGTAPDSLKAGNYAVKTAMIKGGVYYTQIDLSATGERFKQIRTQKTDGDKPCLVLCESGNASIVVTNDGCYILKTDDALTEIPYSLPYNDWPQNAAGKRLAYAVEDANVYSCPYMSEATKTGKIKSGAEYPVTVTEKFTLDFMSTVFYRITYTDGDGNEASGFVAGNFLTAFDYAGEDLKPTDGGDKEFSYKNNVTTVVLVVVIVALVIVAVMYLSLAGAKKNKNKKKTKKKEDDGE